MIKQLTLTIAAVLLLAHVVQCKEACWTQWFNRDGPDGAGDFETLQLLRDEYPGKICRWPLDIQAVTVERMIPAEEMDQTFAAYSIYEGFVCLNKDQKIGFCWDYKVRFRCPCTE